MRVAIFFMCLTLATADLEQFFTMWKAAMERLAVEGDNTNVQPTTQSPVMATTAPTPTYVTNRNEPRTAFTTHKPWASYQENRAFVYGNSRTHQQLRPTPLHHQMPGRQQYPTPSYYAASQAVSTAPTKYANARNTHTDVELTNAEEFVSTMQRQLGFNRNAPFPYQDRYTSNIRSPTMSQARQTNNKPLSWYQLNFRMTYPPERFNSNTHHSLKRTRYPRELSVYTPPGMSPYYRHRTPAVQPWQSPYMTEEEYEQMSKNYGWVPANPYPPQTTPSWNQRYQYQRLQQMQALNRNYGRTVPVYQPAYTTNMHYHHNTAMNQARPSFGSSFNPASRSDQQGMEMRPSIPTFKTAFTRSNIAVPQNTGITAYMGRNQNGWKPPMPSYNAFPFNTPLSWPSQTEPKSQTLNHKNEHYQQNNPIQTSNPNQQNNPIQTSNQYHINKPTPTSNPNQLNAHTQTSNQNQLSKPTQNKNQNQQNVPTQTSNQNQLNVPTQINNQNYLQSPPAYTPQEAAQFKIPPLPQHVIGSNNNPRPASPEEIVKLTTRPMSDQPQARTPTMDQLAYFKAEYMHRILLQG